MLFDINKQRLFGSFCLLLVSSLFLNSSLYGLTKSEDKKENEFSITYKKAKNKNDSIFEKLIRQSTEIATVSELINQELSLEKPITLIFGEDDGPLYDGETNQIHIPYGFLAEVKSRFKQAKYQNNTKITLDDLVIDALLHTIFHELAHALIDQLGIPVLGKEEDAADGLASVFLIEYYEQGQEILITAADLFDLESQDIEVFEKQDFWDEHSLDIQRYYNSMCHAYGSAPKEYKQIKIEEQFTDEKAENCIDDYSILVSSWMVLLEPHLNQ